jgi:hypothetical protein
MEKYRRDYMSELHIKKYQNRKKHFLIERSQAVTSQQWFFFVDTHACSILIECSQGYEQHWEAQEAKEGMLNLKTTNNGLAYVILCLDFSSHGQKQLQRIVVRKFESPWLRHYKHPNSHYVCACISEFIRCIIARHHLSSPSASRNGNIPKMLGSTKP